MNVQVHIQLNTHMCGLCKYGKQNRKIPKIELKDKKFTKIKIDT